MNNPFKNNSLASGLFGYILGALTMFGGSYLVDNPAPEQHRTEVQSEPNTNANGIFHAPSSGSDSKINEYPPYRGLSEDPEGDVLITKTGDCYHSIYGCSSVRYTLRKVIREKAESVGFTPCSKCNP